jgi:hypothetical protein
VTNVSGLREAESLYIGQSAMGNDDSTAVQTDATSPGAVKASG